MRKSTISTVITLGTIAVFLYFKLSHLVFRFGDGNAYVYMAYQFGRLMPYRDFFLADPPFFVMVLAFFKLFFGKNLLLFQALPVVLESATAFLLYLILKKWDNPLSFLAPVAYLLSFTVLSTSDYLTGVQLVVFLSVLALWLWEKGWLKTSGFMWSLAVLTKLYALPALIGFAAFVFLQKERRTFWRLVIGASIGPVLVLLPFVFSSAPKIFDYLLAHQLNRPAGIGKLTVLKFFMAREWLLIILATAGIFVLKKWAIIAPFVLLASFFLIYQDLYYLYLDNLLPFLVLFCLSLLGWLWMRSGKRKTGTAFILVLYAIFVLSSLSEYRGNFTNRGRFLNSDEIAEYVRMLPEDFDLYGSHEIAPLVALKSGRKLFDNQIDTNTQAFSSGALSLEEISRRAAAKGVFLLARITDRPEYGITDSGYEGFFSRDVFGESCRRLKVFPSTSNESDNLIVIFRCKSN